MAIPVRSSLIKICGSLRGLQTAAFGTLDLKLPSILVMTSTDRPYELIKNLLYFLGKQSHLYYKEALQPCSTNSCDNLNGNSEAWKPPATNYSFLASGSSPSNSSNTIKLFLSTLWPSHKAQLLLLRVTQRWRPGIQLLKKERTALPLVPRDGINRQSLKLQLLSSLNWATQVP